MLNPFDGSTPSAWRAADIAAAQARKAAMASVQALAEAHAARMGAAWNEAGKPHRGYLARERNSNEPPLFDQWLRAESARLTPIAEQALVEGSSVAAALLAASVRDDHTVASVFCAGLP